MGGGLESRCVGRVYGADGAVHSALKFSVSKTVKTCMGVDLRFPHVNLTN